jgi:lipoate-protein ligase A
MPWLDLTYPDISWNLALDEALLIEVEERSQAPLIRLWEARQFAVVLGASGRMHEDVHVAVCEADGVVIARRSSGGGTVVIGPGALNVTVILPRDAAPGLEAVDRAQAYVLERTADALRRHSPDVQVKGSGDLTLGDRKFAGSAQRRLKRCFLVHFSILYDFPVALISRYTAQPRRQPAYRADRPHEDFVRNLALSRPALVDCLRLAWVADSATAQTVDLPEEAVRRLVAEKFGDPAWIKRL